MSLKSLYLEYLNCEKCHLCKKRNKVVFGEGPMSSKIMFVGEGPGQAEDLQGRPFIGKSGKLLDKLMKKVDLPRDEVFFTNAVCCRPTKEEIDKRGRPKTLDRPPTLPEVEACRPRLHETIRLVDPILIVTLGVSATKAVLRKNVTITAIRGTVCSMQIKGKNRDITYSVLPTMHPAYLLRNPDTSEGGWVHKVLEDLSRASSVHKEAKTWLGS